MGVIDIKYVYASHDCDNCGDSNATGFVIITPEGTTYELKPSAHCFDDVDYTLEDALKFLIERYTGHTIEVEY